MRDLGEKILFTFFLLAARIRLLLLNDEICAFCFSLKCYILLELTGPRSVGLRLVEDDPNPRPNPNPRCRSVKLCTPTTHRTPTSSASMPTMSSTSSRRVSVGSKRCLLLVFVNLKGSAALLCLFRCVRLVVGPPTWKAGTLPQQLRDQDLEEGLEEGRCACQTGTKLIFRDSSALGGIWVRSSD